MRLSEMRIDGFGVLHDLHLGQSELGPGLNIFYGPNEAGKSTLMAFIRAMVMGFKNKGWPEFTALKGGRLGGYLVFTEDDGREYRIDRYQKGRKEEKKVDDSLDTVLERLTPAVYRNVFAFDLDEMRRFEELSQLEVSAYIYGAGTGVGADRLTAALNGLKKEMEELFKPSGKNPQINQLAVEIHRIDKEISELQQQPEQFARLNQRVDELEREWALLTEEQQRLEVRHRRLEVLERVREIWSEIEMLKQRLAELSPAAGFPASGMDRLNRLCKERETITKPVPPTDYPLEERENALSDLDFNFHRLEALENELAHLKKRREDLVLQKDLLEAEQNLSPMVPLWAGGIIIALMAVLSTFAFYSNRIFGVVTLIITLLLGGLVFYSGIRTARENVQRRENRRQSNEYFTQQLSGIDQEILKAEGAMEDYTEYNQKLMPIALGVGEAAWEDVSRGIYDLNREKEARQRSFLLEQDMAALLKEAGVENEGEFRKMAEDYRQAQEIIGRISQCEDRMLIIGGETEEAREQMEKELKSSSHTEYKDERENAKQKLTEVNSRLKIVGGELGSIREQKKNIETSDRLAEKMLEREMKINTLKALSERWQVLCLSRRLIELAKEKHEQTRQPEVLRRASGFFSQMTGNKYRRLLATVGKTDQIEVETAEGTRISAKELSRGTASQLYLSVRLALAHHYQDVGLPLILDEVLVDFDQERSKGAMAVLKLMAQDRQILYFTCHRRIIEIADQIFDCFNIVYLEEGVKTRSEEIKMAKTLDA